jgi:hypothetical protein
MTKRFYTSVNGFNYNEILKTDASEIVLLSETEWEINIPEYFLNELKVPLRIVLGSFESEYYNERYKNVNVEYWDTHWLGWSQMQLKHEQWFKTYKPNIEFKYPFISLNNRSHIHRCVFIDELAKQNLVDRGIVTWIKHLNENRNYPYQYFDNQIRKLDDDFQTQLNSFIIPQEFHDSFFHVVTEATCVTPFLTEKTAIPLLLKKPFMIIGSQYYNQKLVELGFKLYDEIIDYAYDNTFDLHERTRLFVTNMHKIVNCNSTEMYELLKPKIEFNYNRALEIINDTNFIPDIIKERCVSGANDLIVDNRYEVLMRGI